MKVVRAEDVDFFTAEYAECAEKNNSPLDSASSAVNFQQLGTTPAGLSNTEVTEFKALETIVEIRWIERTFLSLEHRSCQSDPASGTVA